MWQKLLFTLSLKVADLKRKTPLAAFVLAVVVLSIVACGSNETSTTNDLFPQVAETSRQFSENDLIAAGFKVGKNYDVDGLTGARAAVNGFFRINAVSVEFEARFYESHEDAVSLGTSFAEDGSGDTAILVTKNANWQEGTRDRRTIFDYRGVPSAKYGTYVIRSNMVLLCEGKDANQGLEHCRALLEVLSELSAGAE